MWLKYIVFIFPYKGKAPDNYFLGSKAGALVSLFFGARSAKDLHLEFLVDLQKSTTARVTQRYTLNPVESKLQRDLREEFRSHVDISLVKPEAIEMLGLAKQNENDPSYIANIWQAIDAQTGGNGKARKKFVSEVFSSEIVNDSLENVRGARDNFFHHGIIPELNDKDIYVALSFLRICLVPPGPLRDSLVQAFEAELTSPTV
jgi:hypothetical protein